MIYSEIRWTRIWNIMHEYISTISILQIINKNERPECQQNEYTKFLKYCFVFSEISPKR